ncbi:MAG: hypothetical protein HY456_03125, partial [Parcubacteria group bacterium]|nr:hypothetical protein [Parcubacteria group bacterium]
MMYSSNCSKISYWVIISLIAAVILPMATAVSHAEEPTAKEVAKQCFETKSNELGIFLDNLDKMDLADEIKGEQELALRKEVLGCLVKLSYAEMDELNGRLTALQPLYETDAEKILAAELPKDFAGYREYYKAAEDKLAAADLNLESVKQLWSELISWREISYIPRIAVAAQFIFTIQQRAILKIAFARHEKIAADIKSLDGNGYFNDEQHKTLYDMLEKAKELLDDAQQLNTRAYTLLFEPETTESATSTPSSTSTEVEINATNTPGVIAPSNADIIDQAARNSLADVKEAYGIFLEMSKTVKTILGI